MLTAYGTANGSLTEFPSAASPMVQHDAVWLDLVEPSAQEEAGVEAFLGIDIPAQRPLTGTA
jgi:magnesium transporter